MAPAFKDVFEERHYPQIRTIFLPTHAHIILRACPNVVEVICNSTDVRTGSTLLDAIGKDCKHVEVLEGFIFYSDRMYCGSSYLGLYAVPPDRLVSSAGVCPESEEACTLGTLPSAQHVVKRTSSHNLLVPTCS